jgi:PIN domain nuclease of toxin-antitoxin system
VGDVTFLLDTHALLWWLFDDPRLSSRAAAIIRDPAHRILVSSASAWEIATKHRLGRLASAAPLIRDYSEWLDKAGFTELPVVSGHALRAGGWELDHRDPFDRMLAAQSVMEGCRLVTRDPVFVDFGLDPLW